MCERGRNKEEGRRRKREKEGKGRKGRKWDRDEEEIGRVIVILGRAMSERETKGERGGKKEEGGRGKEKGERRR